MTTPSDTRPEDRPDWPLPSFDARDWAAAFCKIATNLGYKDAEGHPIDEGWMIGWFANALMRGLDEATPPITEGAEAVRPPLPEPDTTHFAKAGETIKYHSVDQIIEFANARAGWASPRAPLPLAEILFDYINYRGEKSHRRARPISLRFGSNKYHTKPQWLMRAVDLARNEEREFAMSDMTNVIGSAAALALISKKGE